MLLVPYMLWVTLWLLYWYWLTCTINLDIDPTSIHFNFFPIISEFLYFSSKLFCQYISLLLIVACETNSCVHWIASLRGQRYCSIKLRMFAVCIRSDVTMVNPFILHIHERLREQCDLYICAYLRVLFPINIRFCTNLVGSYSLY
jgi:hypothetical protein